MGELPRASAREKILYNNISSLRKRSLFVPSLFSFFLFSLSIFFFFFNTHAEARARPHAWKDPYYFALTQFPTIFFPLQSVVDYRRFQRGECADDISMVYIKTVFVFSIRLIRTVTGNTAGGCALGS